jgi:hypothetical protein
MEEVKKEYALPPNDMTLAENWNNYCIGDVLGELWTWWQNRR